MVGLDDFGCLYGRIHDVSLEALRRARSLGLGGMVPSDTQRGYRAVGLGFNRLDLALSACHAGHVDEARIRLAGASDLFGRVKSFNGCPEVSAYLVEHDGLVREVEVLVNNAAR